MTDKNDKGVVLKSDVQVISKGEVTQNTVSSAAALPEDEFKNFYGPWGLIAPPYDPRTLRRMVKENNTLPTCISAMTINIDGTGAEVTHTDKTEDDLEDDPIALLLNAFIKQPYPGQSFITQRKALRVDQETTGNGYLEVIRNVKGEIVFTRVVDAAMMRMVRLDDAVSVEKTIIRGGKSTDKVILHVRERRYAQKVGTKLIWFRDFGTSRNLNRLSGVWEGTESSVPWEERANEIIHFTAEQDDVTPYGVPRWIAQTPSVVGSRKAEEMNLEFFDTGGVPPVMITVSGGRLIGESAAQLKKYFSSKPANNQRAVILEVMGSGGSLQGKDGAVKVSVERFGSERQRDSLFEEYDEKCENRVRSAFRLPSMFVGRMQDQSYATAYTSYTLAEAQVFAPERVEFDQKIDVTLMAGLRGEGNDDYCFRSLPITATDIKTKLEALKLALGLISGEETISTLNELAGLGLVYDPGAEQNGRELEVLGGTTTGARKKKQVGTSDMDPTNGSTKKPGAGSPANAGGVDASGTPPSNSTKSDFNRISSYITDLGSRLVGCMDSEDEDNIRPLMEDVRKMSIDDKDDLRAVMARMVMTKDRVSTVNGFDGLLLQSLDIIALDEVLQDDDF